MAFDSIASMLWQSSPAAMALTVAAVIASVLFARELWSWLRLRHVPGPFFNSISMYPMIKLTTGGKMSFVLKKMQSKYGTSPLS